MSDINISVTDVDVKKVIKEAVREQTDEKISDILNNIDIDQIVHKKLESIVNKAIITTINNQLCGIEKFVKKEVRKVILEEIQKKPLTGNVIIKVENIESEW